MKTRKFALAFGLTVLTTAASFVHAGPPAEIEALSWMTGNWAGALGQNQLEENWIAVEGSSIAAMVRMTSDDATGMFEMITIEEEAGSLVLHIQQFNPGFVPRTPAAQKMELSEIGENRVNFVAVGEGGMKSLGYSHPNPETFIIHVVNAAGNKNDITLSARSIWKD